MFYSVDMLKIKDVQCEKIRSISFSLAPSVKSFLKVRRMTNQLEAPAHLWSSAVYCALISFQSAPLSSDSRTATLIYLTEWEALNRICRKTMEMKDET